MRVWSDISGIYVLDIFGRTLGGNLPPSNPQRAHPESRRFSDGSAVRVHSKGRGAFRKTRRSQVSTSPTLAITPALDHRPDTVGYDPTRRYDRKQEVAIKQKTGRKRSRRTSHLYIFYRKILPENSSVSIKQKTGRKRSRRTSHSDTSYRKSLPEDSSVGEDKVTSKTAIPVW